MDTVYELLQQNVNNKEAVLDEILKEHLKYIEPPESGIPQLDISEEQKLREKFSDYYDALLGIKPAESDTVLFLYDDEPILVGKGDIYSAYLPRYRELSNEQIDDGLMKKFTEVAAITRWYTFNTVSIPVREILGAEIDYSAFTQSDDAVILSRIIHLCARSAPLDVKSDDEFEFYCFDVSEEAEENRMKSRAFEYLLGEVGRKERIEHLDKFAEFLQKNKKYFDRKIQMFSEYTERYLLPCKSTFRELLNRYSDEAIIRKIKEIREQYPDYGDLHMRSLKGLTASLQCIRNTTEPPECHHVIFVCDTAPAFEEPISVACYPYFAVQKLKETDGLKEPTSYESLQEQFELRKPLALGILEYRNLLAAEVCFNAPENARITSMQLTAIASIDILASMSGNSPEEKDRWIETTMQINEHCLDEYEKNAKENQKLPFEEKKVLRFIIERGRYGYTVRKETAFYSDFTSKEEVDDFLTKKPDGTMNNTEWFIQGSKIGFGDKEDINEQKLTNTIRNYRF